jgi:alpha-L-arabinofuranosidase
MTNNNSVSATPMTPSTIGLAVSTNNVNPVLTAPIDTILFNDDSVPVEIMADLIFENIGGQELINIARNDTVNGQTILYQPIKNLTAVQQQYNPNNIVSLQATSDKYFQNFSIKFDEKVPTQGTGPGGAHVYIDPETGELVVEAINLEQDEQIEVEITISGTIYEAEI